MDARESLAPTGNHDENTSVQPAGEQEYGYAVCPACHQLTWITAEGRRDVVITTAYRPGGPHVCAPAPDLLTLSEVDGYVSEYGWVITHDLTEKPGDTYAVGIAGPRTIPAEIQTRLDRGEGREFRLFDDDGEHYYTGRYIGPDDEDMFGPLDDFGKGYAGCTEIHYCNDNGNWEAL
jgi:hypothetical protein